MNPAVLLLLSSLSLLLAMDNLPIEPVIQSFTESDLSEFAHAATTARIQFAVENGMLPIIFSYLVKPETVNLAVEAVGRTVEIAPKYHGDMMDAGLIEGLTGVISSRFNSSKKEFDVLITKGLLIIRALLSKQESLKWEHVKDVPHLLEAILFIKPTNCNSREVYKLALDVFSLLTEFCDEARAFIIKKPFIIKLILDEAHHNTESAICTLFALAQFYYKRPFTTGLFKNDLPKLVTLLKGQLQASDADSKYRALALIFILIDGPDFMNTKLFNSELLPLIVANLKIKNSENFQFAFAIMSQLMEQDFAADLYRNYDGSIMGNYLDMILFKSLGKIQKDLVVAQFFGEMNYTFMLNSVSQLFLLDPVKATKEFKSFDKARMDIIIKQIGEEVDEPDAEMILALILSNIP